MVGQPEWCSRIAAVSRREKDSGMNIPICKMLLYTSRSINTRVTDELQGQR
jgi:hypothetical protein